jgi:hypothetical protein
MKCRSVIFILCLRIKTWRILRIFIYSEFLLTTPVSTAKIRQCRIKREDGRKWWLIKYLEGRHYGRICLERLGSSTEVQYGPLREPDGTAYLPNACHKRYRCANLLGKSDVYNKRSHVSDSPMLKPKHWASLFSGKLWVRTSAVTQSILTVGFRTFP